MKRHPSIKVIILYLNHHRPFTKLYRDTINNTLSNLQTGSFRCGEISKRIKRLKS